MPVHTSEMNVGAKVEHFVSSLIDIDAAADVQQPQLKDPENRIAIVAIQYEVKTALATGTATVQVGNSSDADAYGSVTVDTTAADGFITGTVTAAGKDIPANTAIQVNHVDPGTVVGDGYVHIWYYRKNEANKVSV